MEIFLLPKKFSVLYEDNNLLAISKPAGINADDFKMRVHRLDKDTSGVLLIAKNDKALKFFQKQFQERKVEKGYIALVVGHLKEREGVIKTLIGRSPKNRLKQKVYLPGAPNSQGKRQAVTRYRLLSRLGDFDLLEVSPKTGRKHQIRCHLAYLGHPIAGDRLYGFRNQPRPEGLERQFLHAFYLKIGLPQGEEKEIRAELPEDLKRVMIGLGGGGKRAGKLNK